MQWEYLIEKVNYLDNMGYHQYRLNQLGKEGWELAAVIMDSVDSGNPVTYFFKRPLKQPREE